MKFNFEKDEGFIFCLVPEDNGRECDKWNTLNTTKLKHMVALVLMAFKWQSTKEGGLLKDSPFKEWLASRPLALRPIYWKISSDPYTRFKMGYEREVGKQIFGLRCYVEQLDD